jgi:hypothetical protein
MDGRAQRHVPQRRGAEHVFVARRLADVEPSLVAFRKNVRARPLDDPEGEVAAGRKALHEAAFRALQVQRTDVNRPLGAARCGAMSQDGREIAGSIFVRRIALDQCGDVEGGQERPIAIARATRGSGPGASAVPPWLSDRC